MKKYILLDVNGTVGTDFAPILEQIENPNNFIYVDKVLAHVKLSTLHRIKQLSESYNATVLWISLRGSDALCLNQLVDVDWEDLDVNKIVDRTYEWSKTATIKQFVNDHPDDLIVVCDDMLRVGNTYNEVKNLSPLLKTIMPVTSYGLSDNDLDDLDNYLKKGN